MFRTSAVGTEGEEEKVNTNSNCGGWNEKISTDRNYVGTYFMLVRMLVFFLEIGCNVELITVDNGERRRNGMSNKKVSD